MPDPVRRWGPTLAARWERASSWIRQTRGTHLGLGRVGIAADVAIGVVILILSWPVAQVEAGIGLDPSWVTALHVAIQRHLQFGSEIAYTYGPLGFLGLPEPYFGGTSLLAFVFVVGESLVLVVAIVSLLRRVFPFWLAAPLAFVISRPISWIAGWNLVGALVFIAAFELLRRYQPRALPVWAIVGLGIATGLSLLGKLNVGIEVALMAGLLALFGTSRHRPAIVVYGVATVGSFLIAWLVLGQNLWDIPAYIRYSLEISLGYNQAMGIDYGPNTDWIYLLGLAVLATAALAAYEATVSWSRSQRLALLAIGFVGAFFLFKTGFVRNNFGPFYVSVLVLLPVFAVPAARSRFTLSVATVAVAVLIGTGGSLGGYVDPSPAIASASSQLSDLAFHRRDLAPAASLRMRTLYNLPPEALSAIGQHTVQVEPFDAGVAFAYPDLRWDPLPVFQTYSAYTPALDELDAAALRAPTAPERILWLTPLGQDLSIDGRSAFADAPKTMVEMICRYEPIASAPTWQVLARVADRCGDAELIGSVTAQAGTKVKVPAESRADRLVVVHVGGVAGSLGDRIQGLLFKTPPWWLTTSYGSFRLVPGNANGPLIVGWTGSGGYVERLALAKPPAELAVGLQVNNGDPANESTDSLTYEFWSIPVAPVTP